MKSFINNACENPNFNPDLGAKTNYCEHCDKNVANISQMSKEEAIRWKKENPDGCVTELQSSSGDLIFAKTKTGKVGALVLATAVSISTMVGYIDLATSDSIPKRVIEVVIDPTKGNVAAIASEFYDALNLPRKVEDKFSNEDTTVVSGGMMF